MVDWFDLFYYDPTSPSGLRWRQDRYAKKTLIVSANAVAGCPDDDGYYAVNIKVGHRSYKKLRCGRVVYEMLVGAIPEGFLIDHKDGNRTNNSVDNLRLVSHKVNSRNRRRSIKNKSGKTGVWRVAAGKYRGAGWRVGWVDMDGKRRFKAFAESVHGLEESFRLACEYREQKIKELNMQGAGYTHDHGKRQ